ncbi:hypothetical protein D3OALGB2SA_542 [Olavius algarvensis associated proteobacterium Delta 3]|nr:hypothetical protein D3OALGB2SA_542 [Olavius algarvensis associated proteobacterium Delta 3]
MAFKALRMTKKYEMHVPASRDQLFPLLCPAREPEWVPNWCCRLVYSKSGRAEAGCVFETDFPDRGHMTWVVTKYDPPIEIQYTVFKSESHVWNLEIFLKPTDAAETHLLWRHTFTGLTREGNRFLAEYTDEEHRQRLSSLERALVHFVNTGTMIEA